MQVQMLNFRIMRLLSFKAVRRWKKPQGRYRDVIEIQDDFWQPYDYVPPSPLSHMILTMLLADGVDPFTAVMRILVTLEPHFWPPGFELLYQTDESAARSF